MAENCIFCKIASGEIAATLVDENATAIAFHDTSPQAPVHVLIIPREHISGVREIGALPATTVHQMLELANVVAERLGIMESGYRLVTNDGADSGQSVFHLHWHLLGGKQLTAGFA
jgi:histidine triad (HIT) family protein